MHLGSEPGKPTVMLHAGGWGAIAAMAMSGMRTLTTEMGLVGETPPEAMAKEGADKLLSKLPATTRGGAIEISHWAFGALGGAVFGVLPLWVRRRGLAGPAYGLLMWLGFEAVLAPALGLNKARASRPVERAAFAADHVLYGVVLARGLGSGGGPGACCPVPSIAVAATSGPMPCGTGPEPAWAASPSRCLRGGAPP